MSPLFLRETNFNPNKIRARILDGDSVIIKTFINKTEFYIHMKYKIVGDNLQIVNIELSKDEKVYAETGSFVYKSQNVKIEAKVKGGVRAAFRRLLTKESFFLAEFRTTAGTGLVGFGPSIPGKIRPIKLNKGQTFIAERGAFLCSEEHVAIEVQKVRVAAGIFGGEGIFLQRLAGPGIVFINVAGDLIEYNLKAKEVMEISRGYIVGFDPSVNYDIEYVGNIKTAVFGGAGLMLAKLTGPGKVILQSINREKLKDALGSKANVLYSGGYQSSYNKGYSAAGIGGLAAGVLRGIRR